MEGKCYNCEHEGEYEWFWLVTDENGNAYSTFELSAEDYNEESTLTEVYICAKCHAEQ
tara:strand:+ start:625 stop:798 length:174 start_codon:yes stop_codon:yes gene_type:complete